MFRMGRRLQVLISAEMNVRLEKASQRSGVSKGEWVRQALREALRRASDPVAQLAALNGPVSDIDQMLVEIEAG